MDTEISGLTHTAAVSPLDVQLARQIQRGYEQWMRERGLDKATTPRATYDAMRAKILSTIVETSPGHYGAADARFLAGRLLWDRSDITGAVQMWRGLAQTQSTDDRASYAAVRAEIGRALGPDGRVDVVRIVGALAAERSRWLRESAERLARFGYTPQTF